MELNQIVVQIAERKAKLNKMVTLMPSSVAKLQMSDIVESLSIWKWEMSAVSNYDFWKYKNE